MPREQLARPAILRWPMLFLGLAMTIAACGRREGVVQNSPPHAPATLETSCRQMSEWLLRRLGSSATATIHAPLVLAGDLQLSEMDRLYVATLQPAMQAMAAEYFTTAPSAPVSMVVSATPESYRRWAQTLRLSAVEDVSDAGYYDPNLRLILVDTSRGTAGALHEMTHALMDFDFADAPLWLREGLASLHEACEVSTDPPRIVGKVGPRGATLAKARQDGRLVPLEELFRAESFPASVRAERYAQARYFCLFLQRRGQLSRVYRELRQLQANSKSLPKALCEESWERLDAQFGRFLSETLPRT
jgi:hypothetical protein